jgi:hypothetical protein
MRRPSRRTVLLGGSIAVLGGAAVAGGPAVARVAPGRYRLARQLGRCGDLPDLPRVRPGPVAELPAGASGAGRIVIGLPPGARLGDRLPVVVLLHGAAGDARTPFDAYGVQYHLAAAVGGGTPPFAVAAVDVWEPFSLLSGRLLELLGAQRLRTDRIGVLGWSRGGAGALNFTAGPGAGRVTVVAAASPALRTAAVPSLAAGLADVPTHLSCGRDDPYASVTADLLSRLRRRPGSEAAGGIFAGCHDSAFRRRMLPEQLPFLGRHLQ